MASMDFARTPPNIGAVIPGKAPVTSLSFHEDGVHLFVASAEDSKLRLVDCQKGTSDQPAIKCQKDGVRLVESTHHDYSVLIAGEGKELPLKHHVNYLSLYDNKILRTFQGHKGKVTNLSMSPVDDCFLSSSEDKTVMLWNVQQAGCLAKLELPPSCVTAPHAVFDSTGLVFGVTAAMPTGSGNLIHLYDARKYSGGAFAELQLDQGTLQKSMLDKGLSPDVAYDLSRSEWTSLQFNTSGKQMLATAKKGLALMLDGFNGSVEQVFVSEGGSKGSGSGVAADDGMAACFTPDDRFVLGGCDDGTIRCWNATSGNLLNKLEGHSGRVGCIASNPKTAMFASACNNTALWIW